MEVLPVVGVEQHTVGNGKVGPITRKLREGFLQVVEQQCRRQE
jgi:D-alanine transaminase